MEMQLVQPVATMLSGPLPPVIESVVGHDVDGMYSTLGSSIVKRPMHVTRKLANKWLESKLDVTKPESVETRSLTEDGDDEDEYLLNQPSSPVPRDPLASVTKTPSTAQGGDVYSAKKLSDKELEKSHDDGDDEGDNVSEMSEEECMWKELELDEVAFEDESSHWNDAIYTCLQTDGMKRSTATAFLSRGNILLTKDHDYHGAYEAFKSASSIARKDVTHSSRLLYATCLLQLARAALLADEYLHLALEASQKACALRFKHLGNTHWDTVQAYQTMGHILWKLQDRTTACKVLSKAFKLQRVIWGLDDPQVALAARELAHYSLLQKDMVQAKRFLNHALDSCQLLGLEPLVEEIQSELSRYFPSSNRNKGDKALLK